MTYLKPSDDFDKSICIYCFDIVNGPEKTKGAEFYRINGKIYCGLNCYQEEKQVLKDKITEEDMEILNKKIKKSIKKKRKTRVKRKK